MALSGQRSPHHVVVDTLYCMCDTAFRPSGVTMFTIIEGMQTTVVLSSTGSSERETRPVARATFVLQHARTEALTDLGVPAEDLAAAAFRDLLDQLAVTAPDKVEFMRCVQLRLRAAVRARPRMLDEVHGDTVSVECGLARRKIGEIH